MTESMGATDVVQDYIEALQQVYSEGVYPGYPPHKDRLIINRDYLDYNWMGRLIVPEGLWDLPDTPGKHNAGEPPTIDQQERFLLRGLQLDNKGRPMHPYAVDLLTNKKLGALCNRGYYWQWGPNYTVDTVVLANNSHSVLLIQRGDTGAWALPGGFVDKNEPTDSAAVRELQEETGIQLNKADLTKVFGTLPVADPRTTLNAWAETTCYKANLPTAVDCRGLDDAVDADWISVRQALAGRLVASHIPLLKAALA